MSVPRSQPSDPPPTPSVLRMDADASAGKYGVSSADSPPTAAGLTQPATPSPSRGRPKDELGGGGAVDRNVAQVSTQPVSSGAVHSGTFRKSPPTTAPSGTATAA